MQKSKVCLCIVMLLVVGCLSSQALTFYYHPKVRVHKNGRREMIQYRGYYLTFVGNICDYSDGFGNFLFSNNMPSVFGENTIINANPCSKRFNYRFVSRNSNNELVYRWTEYNAQYPNGVWTNSSPYLVVSPDYMTIMTYNPVNGDKDYLTCTSPMPGMQ